MLQRKVCVYIAKKYPDSVTYNLNVEKNLQKTKDEWENGYGEYSAEEYRKKFLETLCIEPDEIWLNDDEFLKYLQYISQEQMLIAKGLQILNDFSIEKPELANDEELDKKIKELNQLREEQTAAINTGNSETAQSLMKEILELHVEIRELYMWNLILNSDLELCVDKNELSNTVPEIYTKEPESSIQEDIDTEELEKLNNDTNEQAQDATQKILNNEFYLSGIIYDIDENYIYFSKDYSKRYYINKNSFSYLNGRTTDNMNVVDIKVGDYLNHDNKIIIIYRNISGDELNQELLYNLTLTEAERIIFVNTIEIEDIKITDNNTATVKIKYGDIIGNELTDETFYTTVEFNSNTKFYSKGNNINSINDLEYAKNNINSIVLDRNTINKESPAIVRIFKSTDN